MKDHSFGEYLPSDKSKVGIGVTAFLIGLGVGATVALLFAPKTGAQTRRAIRRGYKDAMDEIAERAETLRERGEEAIDTLREKTNKLAQAAGRHI